MLLRLLLRNKFAAALVGPNLRLVHLLLLSRRLRTFFFAPARLIVVRKPDERISEKRRPEVVNDHLKQLNFRTFQVLLLSSPVPVWFAERSALKAQPSLLPGPLFSRGRLASRIA